MGEPDASQATCLLCQPPQVIGAGILDHLRLFHPGWDDPGPPVPASPQKPFEHAVMTATDLGEHGARCMDCNREFAVGDQYVSRLAGFIEDTPLTEIVCVPCGEDERHGG